MRVAVLSSASAGGAGIAAFRIYNALCDQDGLDVDFLDVNTLGETVNENVSPQTSASNSKISNTHFTIDYAKEPRGWIVDLLSGYDILNIHWASYLISLGEIYILAKKGVKILFTLHDFYYITGGCHYPATCNRYLKDCSSCPQLDMAKSDLLTVKETREIKKIIFSQSNVHISAPSKHLITAAINSGLVPSERTHLLRNIYKPTQEYLNKGWGNNRSILLIADSFSETRKGLQLAVDSLKSAFSEDSISCYNLELHLVGGMDHEVINQLHNSPVKIITHGHIKEHDKLVDVFKQCQFILTCSFEDNWPNVLVESGCYGCIPIVGPGHGCEEFVIEHGVGYVSPTYIPSDFKNTISTALKINHEELQEKQKLISSVVREKHHSIEKIKSKLLEITNK